MIELLGIEKRIKGAVTERDIEILKNLAKYRYLTTQDVKRLVFRENVNTLRTQVRLKFLSSLGLVNRLMQFNSSGSRKAFAYFLSQQGAEYLLENNEDVTPSFGKYAHNVKYLHLQHCLDISGFWVTLSLALEKEAGLELSLFIPDWQVREKALKEGNVLKNKEIWQEVSVPNTTTKLTVYPDAIFVISAKDADGNLLQSKLFALEVDRGTESLEILRKKILAYSFAYNQGKFKKYQGSEDFTVLIQTSSPKRASNLRQALIGLQGEEMVWVTSVENVSDNNLLRKDIWIDAKNRKRTILV